jgi:beta-lactamase regulating signal transducer with metallopeptidase domain
MPALRIAQRALSPIRVVSPNSRIDVFAGLGLLWLGGFILFSTRVARQLLAAEGLRRRAAPIDGGASFARARSDAGYTHDVPILVSLDVDVPLALGMFHPAIIVPASSSEWSEEEWYVVLLHELAHLARRDLVARAVGMTAGLVHWFNPLVPWMRNMMERDAELAADAMVLNVGVPSSGYADVLLTMAERASCHSAPEPSLTFARANGLELRIGEILRAAPARPRMRRSTELSVTMTSMLVAAVAGCLHVSVQTPRIESPRQLPSVSHQEQQTPSAPQVMPTVSTRRDPVVDARDWKQGARAALVDLLSDPSPQVRAAAAHSLEQLAPAHR